MLNKVVKDKIYIILNAFDFSSIYSENPSSVAGIFANFVLFAIDF